VSEIAKDPIQLYMESAQAKVDKATEVDLPCLTCCSIMNLEDGRKKTMSNVARPEQVESRSPGTDRLDNSNETTVDSPGSPESFIGQ